MAVRLHRAARTDQLADALGELLAVPLADPFATETVVVPAKGVERWLSQRLSHRLGAAAGRGDGICAGVDFRSPWSLFAALREDDDDPWAPDELTWPLLGLIDEVVEEPWAAVLARHLGRGLPEDEADLRRGRRLATARRLARLFASYALQRPSLLESWADRREQVPDDLAWQPELWRRLVEAVGGPSPLERHREAIDRLGDQPDAVDLPERLSLFGHTRLPESEIALLAALGEHREVHLWLPHPSRPLWEALRDLRGPVPRRQDRSVERVGHPLLATLGRDTRELQRSLATIAYVDEPVPADPPTPATLLGWLQGDLRSNRVGPTADRVIHAQDGSVQVHACHGPARQVEVLREVLLGLLADDPTLEPRDVLVMCPDVETYAPLIEAGFGLADVVGHAGHPAHRLRVQLADRALDRTNPLLDLATRLLDLAGGRAGVGDVLDLAHLEPVRRRFRLREEDLQQLAEWARETGIRWGFDAAHRAGFGLEGYVANTWEFGLDRLLAGVTMSEDAGTWLDRTLPLDDVGSGDIDLVGRLAEFVDRLRQVTDRLVGSHPLEHWLTALSEGMVALADVPAGESWQSGQVQRLLGQVREAAAGRADIALRLPDVRALLADRLEGRPTRANFRTGTLTVATLVPMRSVPHRVVCLLGLDDGVFPRAGIADGDDVLAREPITGERDSRSEDRQLMLDAILAATDTLVVTYSGAGEFSGQSRPPAVPVGELLDALELTARCPGGSVREHVTIQHPLQPFDARNLTSGALVPGRPFTFDRAALAGASAARAQVPASPFLPGPLTPAPAGDVLLQDLLSYWKGPVRAFLRDRLDVALAREEEPLDDGLPVEIDNLVQWGVGERVLGDLLAGHDPETARQHEWRRGVLPPGFLGWRLLADVLDRVKPIARAALELRGRPPRAVDIDVDLGDGRRLRGTVPQVYGDRLVPVSYSRLGATHRLQSWIQLLALAASDEDSAWTAHTLGRPANGRSRSPVGHSQLGPLDHRARELLRDLVSLRDGGLCEPLPFPLKASFAYARHRRTQATIDEALEKAGWDWRDGRFPGECSDAEHVRIWGAKAALPGTGVPPLETEGYDGETSRFGALAMRVWSPLLIAEQGSW